MIDIKVAFYFQAKYRRRSQRKPRTKFFKGESALPIRQIDRGDVHVAYRFPAGRGEISRTEVLLVEEKLWWPMSFDKMPGYATLAQLQTKLLDRDFDMLGIGPRPPFELASTPFADPSIKRVWWDATDEALAHAHQKIAENLMIYDGTAYAVGGEPVYFPVSPPSAPKSWSAMAPCFVNPGRDRAIDLCRTGLRWQPGAFTTEEVQACLRSGGFVALRDARRLPCDTRNLLGELDISTKAPDSLDSLEPQVDACVRELWRLTHSTAWAFAEFFLSRDPDHEMTKRMLQRIALDLSDKAATVRPHQSSPDEITLGRTAAIEEFVRFVERSGLNLHRPDLVIEYRQIIERLDRRDRPAAQAGYEFTTEDEQALASLA